jgi:hypothetical protein
LLCRSRSGANADRRSVTDLQERGIVEGSDSVHAAWPLPSLDNTFMWRGDPAGDPANASWIGGCPSLSSSKSLLQVSPRSVDVQVFPDRWMSRSFQHNPGSTIRDTQKILGPVGRERAWQLKTGWLPSSRRVSRKNGSDISNLTSALGVRTGAHAVAYRRSQYKAHVRSRLQ